MLLLFAGLSAMRRSRAEKRRLRLIGEEVSDYSDYGSIYDYWYYDREEDENKLGDAARGERDNVGLKRKLYPPRVPQPHRGYDVTLSRPGPQPEIFPDSDLCLDTR